MATGTAVCCASASQRTPSPARIAACRQAEGRRVLHVQSISEWAPSCIGPYSQATRHCGLILFAGQVRLWGVPYDRKLRAGLPTPVFCLPCHFIQVAYLSGFLPECRLRWTLPQWVLWVVASMHSVSAALSGTCPSAVGQRQTASCALSCPQGKVPPHPFVLSCITLLCMPLSLLQLLQLPTCGGGAAHRPAAEPALVHGVLLRGGGSGRAGAGGRAPGGIPARRAGHISTGAAAGAAARGGGTTAGPL